MLFRVWVSRRLWPWPKKFVCESFCWSDGRPDPNGLPGVPAGTLVLILKNKRHVFIRPEGRIITYGREFHEWQIQNMEAEAGQGIPMRQAS